MYVCVLYVCVRVCVCVCFGGGGGGGGGWCPIELHRRGAYRSSTLTGTSSPPALQSSYAVHPLPEGAHSAYVRCVLFRCQDRPLPPLFVPR